MGVAFNHILYSYNLRAKLWIRTYKIDAVFFNKYVIAVMEHPEYLSNSRTVPCAGFLEYGPVQGSTEACA